MTGWQLLMSTWSFDPSVLLGCTAMLAAYILIASRSANNATLLYVLGVIVLLFALVSPLDTLGDHYLFSAHMIQHLLLVLIVPPFLLLGIPGWVFEKILAVPLLAKIERVLRQLLVAWALGTGALWVWHLPVLYNAALNDENVHIVQHLSFLVTATIFWWPVCSPLEKHRMPSLGAVAYLFAAATASNVLGIILTFSPAGLYPTYLHPLDKYGILPLIRDGWGLPPGIDQQLGGMIMWVPWGLVYLLAMVGVLARWYSSPEEDDALAESEHAPLLTITTAPMEESK